MTFFLRRTAFQMRCGMAYPKTITSLGWSVAGSHQVYPIGSRQMSIAPWIFVGEISEIPWYFWCFFAEFLEKPHGNHHIKYIKILEDPILSNVFHGCMMLYAVVCSCIHIFSVGILIISLIPTLSLRELVLQLPRPQRIRFMAELMVKWGMVCIIGFCIRYYDIMGMYIIYRIYI